LFFTEEGVLGFDYEKLKPSEDQLIQLPLKIEDVYKIFSKEIAPLCEFKSDNIIPFSADFKWGNDKLKLKIFNS